MTAEEALELYHPHPGTIPSERWKRIRPDVLRFVRASFPCSAGSVQQRLRVTGQYMQWCLSMGYGTDPEVIFTEDLTEAFFDTNAVTPRSKATFRSQLRSVARANNRTSVWTPTPEVRPHNSLRPPYTEVETRQYLTLVKHQNTPRRRRVLDVTLHAGLALGLSAPEILGLRREDLEWQGDVLVASIPGRTVPARQDYRDRLWQLAQETEGSRLLGDHLAPKRSFENLLREVQIPEYLPPLRVRRLRTTWLVTVLAAGNLTLPEFQQVSGLKSGRVLDDLVAYLPMRADYLERAARS